MKSHTHRSAFLWPQFFLWFLTASWSWAHVTSSVLQEVLDTGSPVQWALADWQQNSWLAERSAVKTHDGVDALRTPLSPQLGQPLSAFVQGPGVLRGWVRVSSEPTHDHLSPSLQGRVIGDWSGEVPWQQFEYQIPAGRKEITMQWIKDATIDSGEDAAWLDELNFTPTQISLEEALDVVGTPLANQLVLSTPPGMTPWIPIFWGDAHSGGDALISSVQNNVIGLRVTVQQPLVLTFQTRTGIYVSGSQLEITKQGDVQISPPKFDGGTGWTEYKITFHTAGASVDLVNRGASPSSGNSITQYLDDMRLSPLINTNISLAEALDAPELTFTSFWRPTINGSTSGPSWEAVAGTGIAHAGNTAAMSILGNGVYSGQRELTTTVTGPGVLSFWARFADWPYTNVPTVMVSGAYARQMDLSRDLTWKKFFLEIPPGERLITWIWNGSLLVLDEMRWMPTPVQLPVPSAEVAVGLTGNVTVDSLGLWEPQRWSQAGNGDDAALVVHLAEGTVLDGNLHATITGPGWFSMALKSPSGNAMRWQWDGAWQSNHGRVATQDSDATDQWQRICQYVPNGSHLLSLESGTVGDRIDNLRMDSNPPPWLQALDTNISQWEMGPVAMSAVNDISHHGGTALRTPDLTSENAALYAKVQGPGTLRFWYKSDTSSFGAGNLTFGYGSTNIFGLPAASDWTEKVVELSQSESYALTWNIQGPAAAHFWLDEVTFTSASSVSIGEALDASEYVWSSSGQFQGLAGASLADYYDNDVLRLLPHDAPAWLETVVQGPGIVDIAGYGVNTIYVDGVQATGAYPDGRILFTPGPHTWRMVFDPTQSGLNLDHFVFRSLPVVPAAEGLDLPTGVTAGLRSSWIFAPDYRTNYAVADAAQSHDGTDAFRLAGSADTASQLSLSFNGPAFISFWCRGEGNADQSNVTIADFQNLLHYGTFPWEKHRYLYTSQSANALTITADGGSTEGGATWIDEVQVTPFDVVPLEVALHQPALTFTTGGEGGTWRGYQATAALSTPPADDEAFAAIYNAGDELRPAWMETVVTGPGTLSYNATVLSPYSGTMKLDVTMQPVAGGSGPQAITQSSTFIPPGAHRVRWTGQRLYNYGPEIGEPIARITNFHFTPAISLADALDAPGLNFTATNTPANYCYGAKKSSTDAEGFTGDDVVQLVGSGELRFPVTGPGWIRYEAGFSRLLNSSVSLWGRQITCDLMPGEGEEPIFASQISRVSQNEIYYERRIQQGWVPAGNWIAVISTNFGGTINALSYTPALSIAEASAAVDITNAAGLSINLPNIIGGATLAPVSHDGVDALQLATVDGQVTPLVEFQFSGPKLFTAWVRTAALFPNTQWDATASAIPGLDSSPSVGEILVMLDGVPVEVPWALPGADGWFPLRLPVTSAGDHVISFSLMMPSWSYPIMRHLLQLDECAITPMSPTAPERNASLAIALDTPALTWTSSAPTSPNGGGAWSGWAAAPASPDATDAAWVTLATPTEEETVPPTSWIETNVTGPGVFAFDTVGGGDLTFSVSGIAPRVLHYYSESATSDAWSHYQFLIPAGPQAIRITAAQNPQMVEFFGLHHVVWEPGSTVSLAAAADTPDRVFETLPDASGWAGMAVPAFSHDGQDAIVHMPPAGAGTTTLRTTISGPALVSFWQTAGVQVKLDGAPLRASEDQNIGGVISVGVGIQSAAPLPPNPAPPLANHDFTWSKEELLIPSGMHTLAWEVTTDAGHPWGMDEFTVTPLSNSPSLAAAIDQPSWQTTTSHPYYIQALALPGYSHDGVDSVLLTGNDYLYYYGDSQSNSPYLTVTVPGPGFLHYRWRKLGQSTHRLITQVANAAPTSVSSATDAAWNADWIAIPKNGPTDIKFLIEGENNSVLLDEFTFDPGLPLGIATGAPELTWTTGGTIPWLGYSSSTSGVPNTPVARTLTTSPGQSWLQTTLTGPGRLFFSTKFIEDIYSHTPGCVCFDGNLIQSVLASDGSASTPYMLVIPPGQHSVRWTFFSTAGDIQPSSMAVHSVSYLPGNGVDPIANALDAPELPWLVSGDVAAWRSQSDQTFDGTDALAFSTLLATDKLTTVIPLPGMVQVRSRAAASSSAPPDSLGPWQTQFWDQTQAPYPITLDPNSVHGSPAGSTIYFDQFTYTSISTNLEDALDQPGQVWETSPENPFVGYGSSNTHDGVDAAQARGNAVGAWLRTTVSGPATVSYYLRGSGDITVDDKEIYPSSSGVWRLVSMQLAAGPHILRWANTNDSPISLDDFKVAPLTPNTSVAEALDFPGTWILDYPDAWTTTTEHTSDTSDAFMFNGGPSASNRVSTYVTGPGRVQFYESTPVEMYDERFPLITMDGMKGAWFGTHTNAWKLQTIATIPPGNHLLSWAASNGFYTNGIYYERGLQALDQVSFTPYASQPLETALNVNGVAVHTNPNAPWKGWRCDSAAHDGVDAAISAGTPDSWLEITVQEGAGELRYFACAPANAGQARNSDYPTQWKEYRKIFSATTPRTTRVSAAGYLWMDQISFHTNRAAFAEWAAAHNLSSSTSPEDDPDANGTPLLMEYAFGLNPAQASAPDPGAPAEAGIPAVDLINDPSINYYGPVLRVTYFCRRNATSPTYEVFFTNDLTAPLVTPYPYDQRTVEHVNADWDRVTVIDGGSAAATGNLARKRFARVRVTLE